MTAVPYRPLAPADKALPLPPLAAGRPFLGHGLEMYQRPLQHMLSLYHRYGPVYRVRVPGREYYILAGLDANRMLSATDDQYFLSRGLFDDFQKELQASHLLINMDGEEHKRLRGLMRPGYSRRHFMRRLDDAVAITRKHLATWPVGGKVGVMDACQRIVTEQITTVFVGYPPEDYFEDVRTFMGTLLRALVTETRPRWVLRLPSYRNARERVLELARKVLTYYRSLPPAERPEGLITDVLAHYEQGGEFVANEDDLLSSVIGPYLAGLDTVAGTLAFMIYAFLKHGVWEQVRAEAAILLQPENLTPKALREAHLLHAAAMETLRMYPVAAFTPRLAAQDFVFHGYRVPRGASLLIANGLTHYLPEYFPQPERFDPARHLPPRKEYQRTPGAFAPFTLGPHTCLGAGTAEIQLMLTIATIVYHLDLALPSPDYQVRQALTPTPSPGFGFLVRVLGRHHL